MSLPRRLVAPLLSGLLLLPANAAHAQIYIADGWGTSDDGLAFATNDTSDTLPGWTALTPAAFPAAISEIPGPDTLYGIHDTLVTGTRVVNLHDTAGLSWLGDGRTPILAKAVVDDEGATWMRQQHIVSLPAGCAATPPEGDRCVPLDLVAELLDLAGPRGTPVDPAPVPERLDVGHFASSGTADRDGTIFSFAGDASVATTITIRDDDTIAVTGNAEIGDGVGGRWRGYDAYVAALAEDGMAAPLAPGAATLQAQAGAVRDAGVDPSGANRRIFECPDSRRGYIVSQFLINGAGRNVGPTVDPGLEGGIPVFVSEIVPFDCGAPANGSLSAVAPPDGPAAGIYCASTRAVHRPFTITVDGKTLTYPSYLEQHFGIVTLGVPAEVAANLHARLGGANGGDFFSVELGGVRADSASQPDAVAWLGAARAGIDSYGPKPFGELQLTVNGTTFDLVDQQRSLFGEAFDVGPSERPVTNCPDFDFTAKDVPALFADGFGSGDVTAWQEANAD